MNRVLLQQPSGSTATLVLSVVFLVAACTASTPSRALDFSTRSSSSAASATSPAATPAPTAATAAGSTGRPASTPYPGSVRVGAPAVTVVDGLRVRSKPDVSDDSYKYEPLLLLGTQLFVLDGPIVASDYTWYEVAPLASRTLPQGWVAVAGRSGDPWLSAAAFACPPVPTDLRALAALLPSVGLACFPRVAISVQARLIECSCDMVGAQYSPSWFSVGNGYLLVEPGVTSPPADAARWVILRLDPAGQHPEVLPIGQVVDVTGVFDHSAALSCTVTESDGAPPVPSQDCRLFFAVTRLAA